MHNSYKFVQILNIPLSFTEMASLSKSFKTTTSQGPRANSSSRYDSKLSLNLTGLAINLVLCPPVQVLILPDFMSKENKRVSAPTKTHQQQLGLQATRC